MKNCQGPSSAVSRRNFGQLSVGILSAGSAAVLARDERPSASERINVGVIGLGSRGFNLINEFLRRPECQIVAVCDVDRHHHRDQAWGKGKAYGCDPADQHISQAYAAKKSGAAHSGLQLYSDYRELIAQKDIDAVVVATPDHWHAACTFAALQAEKDVYCEKPVTHLFAEGQAIVAEVACRNAVFQTGSQQRSDRLFQKVVELARNGVLGDVTSVEVGLPPGYDKAMGSTKIVAPRAGLDYEFWCGPAEVLPLMQARHHRWWRGHRAYGGGVLMDWIGHHNDIAHWAIGAERSGPIKVEAVDWVFPTTHVYNTPQQYTIRCEYDGGITSTISSRNAQGLKVIGSEGWVYARRGRIEASDKRWLANDFQPGPFRISASGSHTANFLENVRSRGECIAPAEIGHRSITPGHLGYVSHALRKPLQWDPVNENVRNDVEAEALLKNIKYRAPWQVPTSTRSA
ncbi:MAG: Gfo/Idh/MocA family oxidoreductase [Fuerstiella sp.]|nr:Gfo/Idh/MocA family oxidoreductase [Fuerstiella sp.]MCP4856544.1 Gfo/Idh/MocA family oxidoreductase [Fuerstiella sp.]